MLAKFKVLLPDPTHCVLKEVWDVHKTGQVPLFSKKVLNLSVFTVHIVETL